nr:cytochrome P450 [Rhodohalobacter sp. 614A]
MRNQLHYIKPFVNRIRRFTADTKTLFLFNGRSSYWLHMGSSLYKHEPAFRKSIDESREIILELAKTDILPNFDETADEFFWAENNIFFAIVAVQIAMCDLFFSRQIYPYATAGFSLGEIAAVYATGAITKKDAYNIVCSSFLLASKAKKEFFIIYIDEDKKVTDRIVEECPFQLYLVSVISQNRSVVLTNKESVEDVSEYLNKNNIKWNIDLEKKIWPYHSKHLNAFKDEILPFFDEIDSIPLRCEFYSATYGKKLPKGSLLEKDYWYKYQRYSVQMDGVFEELNNELINYQIVQIGPDFFTVQTKNLFIQKNSLKPLSTLKNEHELQNFQNTLTVVKHIAKNSHYKESKTDAVQRVINNYISPRYHFFQNPHVYFKYLEKHGKVHYLPDLNAYLLLDYKDIKYVLENPSKFSSSIFSSMDHLLLGADPPDHKKIRTLLQPLFNRKTYKNIEEYAAIEAENLIANFPVNRAFNFVNEFSIPLTKKVISEFLGLTHQEALEIEKNITDHLYSNTYFDQLLALLSSYLTSRNHSTPNGGINHLLELTAEGIFSVDDAARLLRILWLAGTTTTSMLISDATLKLLQSPSLTQTLLNNNQLIDPFIEECLRLEAPESNLKRLTTEDVVISGQEIPKGSVLHLSFSGANKDISYFEDPDQIRFDRPSNAHLSFGGGIHHCLGKVMARFEAQAAVRALLPIISSMKLKEGLHAVSYFSSLHFRGLENLDVIFEGESGQGS